MIDTTTIHKTEIAKNQVIFMLCLFKKRLLIEAIEFITSILPEKKVIGMTYRINIR